MHTWLPGLASKAGRGVNPAVTTVNHGWISDGLGGWSHHEERHDDRYFDCDGHVDGTSEHTRKERHRDLVVDKEMLVKLTEAHAQLLQTITMSHMAETQGGRHIIDAECWDSGKDLNQGTNLIVELFERGLGSMRAVAVGTEARDHNDVTHLERALTCLDHVLCGDRFDHEPVDSDLVASGRQGGSRVGVECIVVICEVVHVNWNNG